MFENPNKESREEVSCAEELATFAGSLRLQRMEERHRHRYETRENVGYPKHSAMLQPTVIPPTGDVDTF